MMKTTLFFLVTGSILCFNLFEINYDFDVNTITIENSCNDNCVDCDSIHSAPLGFICIKNNTKYICTELSEEQKLQFFNGLLIQNYAAEIIEGKIKFKTTIEKNKALQEISDLGNKSNLSLEKIGMTKDAILNVKIE